MGNFWGSFADSALDTYLRLQERDRLRERDKRDQEEHDARRQERERQDKYNAEMATVAADAVGYNRPQELGLSPAVGKPTAAPAYAAEAAPAGLAIPERQAARVDIGEMAPPAQKAGHLPSFVTYMQQARAAFANGQTDAGQRFFQAAHEQSVRDIGRRVALEGSTWQGIADIGRTLGYDMRVKELKDGGAQYYIAGQPMGQAFADVAQAQAALMSYLAGDPSLSVNVNMKFYERERQKQQDDRDQRKAESEIRKNDAYTDYLRAGKGQGALTLDDLNHVAGQAGRYATQTLTDMGVAADDPKYASNYQLLMSRYLLSTYPHLRGQLTAAGLLQEYKLPEAPVKQPVPAGGEPPRAGALPLPAFNGAALDTRSDAQRLLDRAGRAIEEYDNHAAATWAPLLSRSLATSLQAGRAPDARLLRDAMEAYTVAPQAFSPEVRQWLDQVRMQQGGK